jgi:CubicO group peptidase (beta-lactamase class C family)
MAVTKTRLITSENFKTQHPMKNPAFFLLLVLLSVPVVKAQTVTEDIDKFMNEKYPAHQPGAAILVAKNDKVIFRKGYGLSTLNPDKPVTPDMVFRIGSITKQFTSTAILKLVEQGKIDLKADITTYLTGFSTPGKTVTVEQLLNHTSGIKSYTSLPEAMEKKGLYRSPADMVKIIQAQPSDFAPNDQWLYNNSGYFLLGMIIEKVSGMPYGDYVSKNLFKPAGMKSSFTDDSNLPANRATGYMKSGAAEFKAADYIHPSVPYSAGALFSTVDDLWKWNQAIFTYKLVKRESLEKAWTPTTLNSGKQVGYGYAWQFGRLGDAKVIGHGGAIDGFLSMEIYVPDQKIYVCILSNSMTVNPEEYTYGVAEIVAGISNAKEPEVLRLTEPALDEYTGVYRISDTEDRVITRKGARLFSQRTGGTKFEIFPYEKDAFFFKDSPARVTFLRNAEGKIEAVELKSREFIPQRAERTNKPIPADRTEIELAGEIFDRYAGEYELAPGFIIKIWREDKNFKAQATGQPAFEIFAESEIKFFLKVVDAVVEFNKDDTGKVVGMTLFQNGNQMPGKKIK